MIGRSGATVRIGIRVTVITAALALVCSAAAGQGSIVERVGGLQPNAPSDGPVCSNGGACVAFYSDATNLLPQGSGGDNNGYTDVYLVSGDGVRRISQAEDGSSANGPSMAQRFRPSIDDNCTCVAYSTDASNLVPNDTNRRSDVVLTLLTDPQVNELMSVGTDGNSANGSSSYASVSRDCSRVAFRSTASNLVDGDENGASDVFVHDRGSDTVTRVSVANDGSEADGPSTTPSISGDGRCVAFASQASNLMDGDTNGTYDIYVSCDGQITCRASVSSDGAGANDISFHPALNEDGTIVAFKSEADNLVENDLNGQPDVFVHNCATGTTERVSIGVGGEESNDIAIPPSITRDGTRVAFGSFGSNLASVATNGRSQIYVRDLEAGETVLISVNEEGEAQNGSSPDLPPSICPDGDFVTFASVATNLGANDNNGVQDIFIGSVGTPPTPTPIPPTPTMPVPCNGDTDCDPGQVCNTETGLCEAAPTPTPTIPCENDEDCPSGLICLNNVCTDPSTPTPTPTPLPTCMTDEDCCEGVPAEECIFRCRAGVCVPQRECEFETADLDCRGERETCVDGFCECGGDCNLNGLAFGTEISTMMCILGGACEEDECVTADVNEDGEVTGCDVTLAVLNLGLGCPGEGTPLIFGAQRISEDRTIAIGSTEATRGEIVTIPLAIEGGGEVSSAHTDILIDTSEVDIRVIVEDDGAILPQCELAPALQGTFDDTAIRLPQVPRNPEGIRRVRVAAIDTTLPFPLDTFGPGDYASCRFRVGADVPTGTIIPLMGDPTRTEIGDFNAAPFNSLVADGSISVVDVMCDTDDDCPEGTFCQNGKCVPDLMCDSFEDCLPRQACVELPDMSGVNRCQCVGDCNLDGRVRSNEITAMINIINGITDVTTCLAADQNGDGRVRANDITLAILNINQGCPGQ
jgi:hypothetical protein